MKEKEENEEDEEEGRREKTGQKGNKYPSSKNTII